MYYKGTKTKCEDYNQLVAQGENYESSTIKYDYVTAHQNGIDFAILKHDKYVSNMEQIENLDGWFDNLEI
jgi:hypothetical protein